MKTLYVGAALSVLAMSFTAGAAMAQPDSGDLPPNAIPGHCYGKLLVPEQYETYSEQVLDRAERTELKVIPAVMGTATQQVLVTEARTEYQTVPATYRTVTETVVLKPATTRSETVPAVYGEESEQVLVSPAHTVWKRGARSPKDIVVPGSDKLLPTGEVMCLVEVPAEYRTVTHQVVRTPETTRTIDIPAETTTVTRQVIDQPARVLERQIPAVYKTVTVTTVAQPERTETVVIPATYRTITKQKIVSASHFEWRQVECEPEHDPAPAATLGYSGARADSSTVTETTTTYHETYVATGGDSVTRGLQAALKAKGYYKGPLSGRFTSATQLAMIRYQRDAGLARGSFDRATAHALGIQSPV